MRSNLQTHQSKVEFIDPRFNDHCITTNLST